MIYPDHKIETDSIQSVQPEHQSWSDISSSIWQHEMKAWGDTLSGKGTLAENAEVSAEIGVLTFSGLALYGSPVEIAAITAGATAGANFSQPYVTAELQKK